MQMIGLKYYTECIHDIFDDNGMEYTIEELSNAEEAGIKISFNYGFPHTEHMQP